VVASRSQRRFHAKSRPDQVHIDAKDIASGMLMLAEGLDIDGMADIGLIAFDSE
jgi:hypothetical protein